MKEGFIMPAEAFPVGDYLKDELDARGWSVATLARKAILSKRRVEEIIANRDTFLTMREAEQIGQALGVNPAIFLSLQLSYRKWRRKHEKTR